MRTPALAMLSLALFTGWASAQGPARPDGPAPTQQTVVFKDGKITWEYVVTFYKKVPVTVTVDGPDGKKVPKTAYKTEQVQEKRLGQIDVKESKVMRADGKAVAAEELAKLLEKPTAVMISSDSEPLDPFYLQFLKPDTLIVLPPKNDA